VVVVRFRVYEIRCLRGNRSACLGVKRISVREFPEFRRTANGMRTREKSIIDHIEDSQISRLIFFLFHPRDYYKLSFCVIFSNLTIYESLEEYMPCDVCSMNYGTMKYINLEVILFLIGVLF